MVSSARRIRIGIPRNVAVPVTFQPLVVLAHIGLDRDHVPDEIETILRRSDLHGTVDRGQRLRLFLILRYDGLPPHRSLRPRAGVCLHDMRQFMRQQAATADRLWIELPGSEHDMRPNRIGQRIDGLRRFRGRGIRMHTHVAEVVPEARLKKTVG